MKINEYPEVTVSDPNDLFVVQTSDGTKKIKSENIRVNGIPEEFTIVPFEEDPVILHNSHFRGKNLGNSITEDQMTNIRNGTFDELWVGDYWEINNIRYRIAGLDCFRDLTRNEGSGYGTRDHHIVLFPDSIITKYKLFNENDASGYSTNFGYHYTNYLLTTLKPTLPQNIKDNLKYIKIKAYNSEITSSTRTIDSIPYTSVSTPIFPPYPTNISYIFSCLSGLIPAAGYDASSVLENILPLFKLTRDYVGIQNIAYPVCIGYNHIYPVVITDIGSLGLTPSYTVNVRPFLIIG